MRGARFALTVVGVAVGAGSPTRFRPSRYPTRTAPAAPDQVRTRLRQLPAATNLPEAAGEPLPRDGVDVVGGRASPHAGRAAGQDVGRQGRWRQ
jgi:hypothetical protein